MDIVWARSQMAMSLGFHIVFAAAGIALPVLMVFSEWRWRKTGDRDWEAVTRAWAKGTAVLFAVGAVSGTVLSFELGLLFPGFMKTAGAAVGLPFALEGFAFFTEAIFLGVYLYGWERVRPSLHLASGVVVALSGLLSALFVTMANAWMNAPRGFNLQDGRLVDIDPLAVMTTPFAAHELIHMVLASYMAVGFAAAAVHAVALLRDPSSGFHRKALRVTLALAVPCTLLQPLAGHFAGQQVARHQPMKLAAMEGLVETRAHAPVHVGPIEIPGGLSLLAHNSPSAVVDGLDEIPREDWPSPAVRWAFQIMVLIGLFMAAVAGLIVLAWLRKRELGRALLWAIIFCGPLGFAAIEAGWTVTEVGRQPWVIYHVLRTAQTATPMGNLWISFTLFALIYLGLSVAVVIVLRNQVRPTLPGTNAMTAADYVAIVMLVSLVFYALGAGADFGGGVWDLLASGRRAAEQRRLIESAIGPIWEANHVWLILVVVLLFSAFPAAYAAASVALHLPLTLLLVGVVLRGSAFVFRHYSSDDAAAQHRWGRLFAVASTITPIFLGVTLGAVTCGIRFTGGVPDAGFFGAWLGWFPFAVGLFALALFAFLAAVYLTNECAGELREDFRLRALLAGAAVGVTALICALGVGARAPQFRHALTASPWSWPLQAATALAALGAFASLWVRRFAAARVLAALQVSLILLGWGAAQRPYLIAPQLTIAQAAAPESVLIPLLWALGLGALTLFPSLIWLYRVFKTR